MSSVAPSSDDVSCPGPASPDIRTALQHLHIDHGKHSRMVPTKGSHNRPTTPGLRKRRIPSCPNQTPEDDPDHRSSKKQKLSHPAFPPARFWDHLSEIPLTRNALRELNERNDKVSRGSGQRSGQRRSPRGRTRLSTSTQKKTSHLLADKFLCRCFPNCSDQIKCFASRGGPDLRDVRGVCVNICLLSFRVDSQ